MGVVIPRLRRAVKAFLAAWRDTPAPRPVYKSGYERPEPIPPRDVLVMRARLRMIRDIVDGKRDPSSAELIVDMRDQEAWSKFDEFAAKGPNGLPDLLGH